MLKFFQRLSTRFKENSHAHSTDVTLVGKQGADGAPPETNLHVSKPNTAIVASHSGPEGGVALYKHFTPDLTTNWDCPASWAYGISQSMYDLGPTGRRNGEPVADCFGIIAYQEGALLAVADGVNWGEPPRRAARCAVLGTLNHMHHALQAHEGDSELDSHTVFKHFVDSIPASQKLILQQFGTLTTLVASVVLPIKWARAPRRWAALTLTVGDSAAYVYRVGSRTVEEITAAAHADGARDPRWCPGALGYALGEEPDLANMMLCLTFVDEGDLIFLTSDGVADNFDPVIRKMARHQILVQQVLESAESELPALSPAECQVKAMQLLGEVLQAAHKRYEKEPGGLTAKALAETLLQHVYEVTEEQRQQVEQRNRDREKGVNSLNTDARPGGLMGLMMSRPPGKMDHATVACYQVGRHKHGGGPSGAHTNGSITGSGGSSSPQGTPGGAASAAPAGAQ